VLAAQRAQEVDYLVTGEKDLLVMGDRFPVVTPAQFWSTHGGI
jgi:predicted nucleic acid-binding protein